MSDAGFIAGVISIVIVPTLGIIGYLLRSLLKTIEVKIDTNATNVMELKLTMAMITSTLTAIEKDIDRQSQRVNEINTMLINNVNKTIEHGHEINNLKAQGRMLAKLIEEK
jgi:hypothetical protein